MLRLHCFVSPRARRRGFGTAPGRRQQRTAPPKGDAAGLQALVTTLKGHIDLHNQRVAARRVWYAHLGFFGTCVTMSLTDWPTATVGLSAALIASIDGMLFLWVHGAEYASAKSARPLLHPELAGRYVNMPPALLVRAAWTHDRELALWMLLEFAMAEARGHAQRHFYESTDDPEAASTAARAWARAQAALVTIQAKDRAEVL